MKEELYNVYTSILLEELVPAMGCTEPIAIAYAAALAAQTLGCAPESVHLSVSGNIVKNVKSVVVPNTGGRKGLAVAVAAGICFGDAEKILEVISGAENADPQEIDRFLSHCSVTTERADSLHPFDMTISLSGLGQSASVHIRDYHTNVVEIQKNGETLFQKPSDREQMLQIGNRMSLTVAGIVEYAESVCLKEVQDALRMQAAYNIRIAEYGLTHSCCAGIGRLIAASTGEDPLDRAKAWAAAASDARMSGCELPVIINSGSGNQGITCSVPVIVVARQMKFDEEHLYRALLVSNLVTIYLKTGIGSLSAYCGATSAGVGAAAGLCFLQGGRTKEVADTITNALAINSGMICDGAKASCAAKIASALEAGFLGLRMAQNGIRFQSGDGIVFGNADVTIAVVGKIAREGMQSTDEVVIREMLSQ